MSKVVVKSVVDGSVGEKLGLEAGDVIKEVYGKPISSRAQLIKTMSALSDENSFLSVIVERAGNSVEMSHTAASDSLGCIVKDESDDHVVNEGRPNGGRLYILGGLGVLTLFVGVYFLLYTPNEVVSLQRLTVGQTLALIGALFIAVEWRPVR